MMPDLQTAWKTALATAHVDERHPLNKTIEAWDKGITSTPPKKIGISRATFEAVRDYPNSTVEELCKIINSKGLPIKSVSTLVHQMLMCGMATRNADKRISTHLKEYTPIKNSAQLAAMTKKEPVATPTAVSPTPELNVDEFISTLSLKNSIALFHALQKMFNSI